MKVGPGEGTSPCVPGDRRWKAQLRPWGCGSEGTKREVAGR